MTKYFLVQWVEFHAEQPLTQSQIDRLIDKDIERLTINDIEEQYGLIALHHVESFQPKKMYKKAYKLFGDILDFKPEIHEIGEEE